MSPLTRGRRESLTDNFIRPAHRGEEVILQMEMRALLTEGRGSRGWKAPKPQMSTRDALLELFMQKQAQLALLSHRLRGCPRSRAQVGVTRDWG